MGTAGTEGDAEGEGGRWSDWEGVGWRGGGGLGAVAWRQRAGLQAGR